MGVLDVELLGEEGSEDEGEAPPSSGTRVYHWQIAC